MLRGPTRHSAFSEARCWLKVRSHLAELAKATPFHVTYLQEHLLHVREPQLFVSWTLKRDKRVQLARRDLVLLELALCFEKRLHDSDEDVGRLGRNL
jgi:hypothetical protein